MHILEGPIAWILSSSYIFAAVVSGYPIFYLVFSMGIVPSVYGDMEPDTWAAKLVLGLDSLLFCFLPLFFCTMMRVLQGRQLFARLGKRTLVSQHSTPKPQALHLDPAQSQQP